jgi:hypothetical protein
VAEQARLAAEAEHARRAADAELERQAAAEDARRPSELDLDEAEPGPAEPLNEPEPSPALVSESAVSSELPIFRWLDGS